MTLLKSRIQNEYFSINQLDSDVLSGVPNLIELDLGQNLINSQNFSPNAFLMNRIGFQSAREQLKTITTKSARGQTLHRQLQIMRLSRNQLETFPMGIPENLFEFSLAYNSIGAIATKSVQSLRQLESLDLNNNQLTDTSFQGRFLTHHILPVTPGNLPRFQRITELKKMGHWKH